MDDSFKQQKVNATRWFFKLRDNICTAFEKLEDEQKTGIHAKKNAGRFICTQTRRKGQRNGGEMSILRNGRLFEKVGVNVSEVYGALTPEMKQTMSSHKTVDFQYASYFWASGISLVAHLQNPKCPAVHFNTRMFCTLETVWFGGGTDLNPMFEIKQKAVKEDKYFFHSVLKAACDRYNPGYYPRFKKWADDYFMIAHRNEARGVGGIFFDDLNSGDWQADFAFTRAVGRAFLAAYLPIIRKRQNQPWTQAERDIQLYKRGRYVEFNLLYDRGTRFGLQSGHDPNAVLMSLPPIAKWY